MCTYKWLSFRNLPDWGGIEMNSNEVSKLLGVSISTIQRWVKQLELPMERNERGHYFYKEEDIEILQQIHKQIQGGALLQDIAPTYKKKSEKPNEQTHENEKVLELLSIRMSDLESSLHAKADSVATYQLLQHRREIDDLQNQVKLLLKKITELENQLNSQAIPEESILLNRTKNPKRTKKKNIVSSLFGF